MKMNKQSKYVLRRFILVIVVLLLGFLALAMSQDKTYQAPASHPYKLPETGTKENAGLAAIGVVGALLGMFAMGKKKDDE